MHVEGSNGEANDAGHNGRRRYMARGAERVSEDGGGWGGGDVQVDGVPGHERRWVADVTERCYDDDRY